MKKGRIATRIFGIALVFLMIGAIFGGTASAKIDSSTESAQALTPATPDLPVDGKGIWIWRLWEVENGNISTIIQRLNSAGVNWVTIKLGDSDSFWTQPNLTPSKINQFHSAGIKVFGWHYVYSYDRWEIPGVSEADVSNQILDIQGIDGLIINAEAEYEGQADQATQYLESIRQEHPHSFIAYSTFARIDSHLWFPYLEFGEHCDAVMPQAYWKERPTTPTNEAEIMKEQWDRWHETWRNAGYGASIKPIIPTGQGWNVTGSEITEFCEAVYSRGYSGGNLFRYGTMDNEMWSAYAAVGGEPSPAITSGLRVIESSPYYVGDTVTAEFTITNRGTASITFDVLTAGGRDPDDQVADFTWREDITLNPDKSYAYQGSLTLSKIGNYHFFCAYYIENPTPEEEELLDENNWNTSVPTESGVNNTLDIQVEGAPNQSPQLSNPSVQPASGSPSTDFYYYVTYFDPDGDSPSLKQVDVDGPAYTMSLYSGSASNGIYRYGPKNLSAGGTHYYFFYFEDGRGGTARLPTGIDMYLGPTVSELNNPPNTPTNPSPANHAADVDVNTDLSWTGGDPDTDSVTYDVYFEKGDSSPDVLVSDDQPGTTYDPGTLDYDSHHYWKIIAKDEHGAETEGDVWYFSTEQAPDTACLQAETLPDLIACIKQQMPGRDSQGFVVPPEAVQSDWRTVVGQMLAGDTPDDITLPSSLSGIYSLATFTDIDNGQTYHVLMETQDIDGNGMVDNGWGTFILNPQAVNELNIQIPHPKYDIGTADQGVGVFKATGCRSFLMAGTHRYANDAASSCQPSFLQADVAHNDNTLFQATVEEVVNFYDVISGGTPAQDSFAAIQFHGMESSTCLGVHVYMTYGLNSPPAIGDKLLEFQSSLEEHNPDWVVTVPGDSPPCGLTGTTNIQGRLLNNVAPTLVCTTGASSYSGRFIHIEQEPQCRDANDWVATINEVFVVDNSPTVSSVFPAVGDTSVSVATAVTATFSEAMDESTITTDSFTLEGSAVSGTVAYDSDTYIATFAPDANLDYDHQYTASLSTAITDVAGNPLAAAHSWSFTTASADEVVTFPDSNLEAAIRDAIPKPTGEIYQSDLEGLASLDAMASGITDIAGLEYCTSLEELYLYGNEISDISPISGLGNLRLLNLVANRGVSDISPLSNLTNLEQLYLSGNAISDIGAVSGLVNLRDLELYGNDIRDISPISGLVNLHELDLSGNPISDISPISGLVNLRLLSLEVTHQLDNLTAVSDLTSLEQLYLSGNEISDIGPISGLVNLRYLRLGSNLVSDISPISGLLNLRYLNLMGNQVSDVSVLSELMELRALYLDDNQITSIASLSNLTKLGEDAPFLWREGVLICLGLQDNEVSDISPLVENVGLDDGDGVDLRDNPLSNPSLSTYIPQLQARGVNVLYDSPNTWYVDDDLQDYSAADFTKIQDAVDAASSGDTITVYPGTYTENVDISKSLTIQSENGAETTIVQAADSNDRVFEVTADDVVINGFTVQGATERSGIRLARADCCDISNNTVLNNFDGIDLWHSSENTICNNHCNNNRHGIWLYNSTTNMIYSNCCETNWVGIYLHTECLNNTICNNTTKDNIDGIDIVYSSNNTILNNKICNNNHQFEDIYPSYHGIYLYYAFGNIIEKNEICKNPCGISSYDSSNNEISLNNFIDNEEKVRSLDSTNIWNSPEEITYTYKGNTYTSHLGNYWDDYAGGDTDGDGIGDTPYSIDGDADNYPLVEPFENYQIGEDSTPPTVSSTSPQNGATGVAIDTAITATFSEAMDASTITTGSFTLEGSPVAGTVTYNSDAQTATFTPDANLDCDHQYTASLSTAITDVATNPLAEAYSWSFTIGDDTPPAPTLSSPTDGGNVPGECVTFRWNAFAGATKYRLLVQTDAGATKLDSQVGNVTTYTETGYADDGSEYSWQVWAGNDAGWSDSSLIWSFGNGISSFVPAVYTNAQYGFSVKYPDDWVERPENVTGDTVASFGVPAFIPGMSIKVSDADGHSWSESIVAELEAGGNTDIEIVSEYETTTADCAPATEGEVTYTIPDAYDMHSFALGVLKDDKWIKVEVWTIDMYYPYYEAFFSEIAHTLRFGELADEIGVWQPSTYTFWLDVNGNCRWDPGTDLRCRWGDSSCTPLVGD